MIVEHDDGFGDGKWELALQNDLNSLIKMKIVESCRDFFIFLAQHTEYFRDEHNSSNDSQRLVDIGLVENNVYGRVKQLLVG